MYNHSAREGSPSRPPRRRTNISLPTATYCGWWLKYIRRPLELVPCQFCHCTKVAVIRLSCGSTPIRSGLALFAL